jgi:hypothetical protein
MEIKATTTQPIKVRDMSDLRRFNSEKILRQLHLREGVRSEDGSSLEVTVLDRHVSR